MFEYSGLRAGALPDDFWASSLIEPNLDLLWIALPRHCGWWKRLSCIKRLLEGGEKSLPYGGGASSASIKAFANSVPVRLFVELFDVHFSDVQNLVMCTLHFCPQRAARFCNSWAFWGHALPRPRLGATVCIDESKRCCSSERDTLEVAGDNRLYLNVRCWHQR